MPIQHYATITVFKTITAKPRQGQKSNLPIQWENQLMIRDWEYDDKRDAFIFFYILNSLKYDIKQQPVLKMKYNMSA